MKGRVLIIAGSDPSGGAGIQADIKTVTALGGYAATAITALTVQNTRGVSAVHGVSPAIIRAQIEAVMDDIGADAVKIGMIGDVATAELLAEMLPAYAKSLPIVLDPVLAATSGDALAEKGVAEILREKLAPLAAVITPNIDEAAALTGLVVKDEETMIAAGKALCALGAKAALMKGGHLSGDEVIDSLVVGDDVKSFRHKRIDTTATHGTGCTLASAIATELGQGMALEEAVGHAIDYVHQAILTAPGFGAGAGPLNHAHDIRKE